MSLASAMISRTSSGSGAGTLAIRVRGVGVNTMNTIAGGIGASPPVAVSRMALRAPISGGADDDDNDSGGPARPMHTWGTVGTRFASDTYDAMYSSGDLRSP